MYFEIPGTKVRVMGSMHMVPASNPVIPIWALQAYDWCEELVFESDPQGIFSELHPTPGVALQKQLSPAAWAALGRIWPPPPHFPSPQAVQPWAVWLFANAFQSRPADGIEPIFLKRAAEAPKVVHFLETPKQLASALDTAPIIEVIQAIEDLANDLSAPQRSLLDMYSAWVQLDLASLYKVAERSPSFHFPGMNRAAFQLRNESWVQPFQKHLLSSKRTLVAVGALHLYGPNNVFDCLGINPHHVAMGG